MATTGHGRNPADRSEQPFVVALSGASGSGKSSVAGRIAALLGDAACLHFDHFASVSSYPTDLKKWKEEGADVDAWQTPGLVEALRGLRGGASISLPEARGVVAAAPYVVLEEPFGRLRSEMAGLIDLVVYLEVPLDVLLARRLLRRLEAQRERFGDGLLERLQRDLLEHLELGRELDALSVAPIREAADLVLDGMLGTQELAERVVREIRSRQSATWRIPTNRCAG